MAVRLRAYLHRDGQERVPHPGCQRLADRVDYHLDRLAAATLLSTLVALGGNLSTDSRGNNEQIDIVGTTVAQQASRVGQRIIDRELNLQPTILVRAGMPFNVLVNRDLILAPYQQGRYPASRVTLTRGELPPANGHDILDFTQPRQAHSIPVIAVEMCGNTLGLYRQALVVECHLSVLLLYVCLGRAGHEPCGNPWRRRTVPYPGIMLHS